MSSSRSMSIKAPTASGTRSPSSTGSTPGSQSMSWTGVSSFSNSLHNRRRSAQARGCDTEFAFYERICDYSDEDSEGYSDDDEEEDEEAADMDLGDSEDGVADKAGNKKPASSEGDDMDDDEVELSRRRKGKARQDATREERRQSFSRRRPVIVLRRDSGWSFSQDAFFSSYQREQYSLCNPRGGVSRSMPMGTMDDDDQPPVLDVFVSQEDSRRILPSA